MKARAAKTGDIEQMLALDKVIFKDEGNRQSSNFLKKWIAAYPDYIFVLEDQNGKIWGRAECLPLKSNALSQLKQNANPLDNSDVDKLLLPLKTAELQARPDKKGRIRGNVLFIGMAAFNPHTQQEGYEYAIPLFLKILWKFYVLGMCVVVGRSCNEISQHIWKNAGGKPIRDESKWQSTSDGPKIDWYFDGNVAQERLASGLSVVYFTNWTIQSSSSGELGLTPREREICRATVHLGYTTDKELADYLGITEEAVGRHFQNIYEKCAPEFGNKHPTRAQLVILLKNRPEEILNTREEISSTASV